MIVGEILDHAIKNKRKRVFQSNQQLLIYIGGKNRVGKNKGMNGIEIGFTLLERRNEFVISALTGSAVNRIGESIVHNTIRINIWVKKTQEMKVNAQ